MRFWVPSVRLTFTVVEHPLRAGRWCAGAASAGFADWTSAAHCSVLIVPTLLAALHVRKCCKHETAARHLLRLATGARAALDSALSASCLQTWARLRSYKKSCRRARGRTDSSRARTTRTRRRLVATGSAYSARSSETAGDLPLQRA